MRPKRTLLTYKRLAKPLLLYRLTKISLQARGRPRDTTATRKQKLRENATAPVFQGVDCRGRDGHWR